MALETDLIPPRYRGPQRIGRGGMGDIFRATDSVLGRAVAIKLLADRYAQDAAIRTRFTREALAAARLSGEPNIITIFDVGEWNGRPFIVMEYLSGGSLEDRLRAEGAQEPGRALVWLEQSARAVDSAHANGIVHRDVKPANLLLDRNGEVHVADFGIASAAGLDSLTMTGTVLGTAGYLAPEQAQGHPTTAATDRYALGVVAFELLTGTRPFGRETPTAEAMAHVQEPVPSVCDRLDELPCELDPVFRRALEKDPDRRFPTCADFVAALRDGFVESAGQTRVLAPVVVPPPPVEEARAPAVPAGFTRRRGGRRWPLLAFGVVAAGLAGGGIAAALSGGGDDGAPEVVQTTLVRTRTLVTTSPGDTVVRTVTRATTVVTSVAAPTTVVRTAVAAPPTTSAPAPTTAPAATSTRAPTDSTPTLPEGGRSVAEGIRLTDQSTALNRDGDYARALPIAQRALANLSGSGETYEAYANFNVGNALSGLGRCREAMPYLNRREALLGPNPDVTRARERCS